jgi:hypothetical protein
MSEKPRDRYEEEALRLVRVLASMALEKRVSVRSLEKKMGVGDSVFSKVLRGKITSQVRHVLMRLPPLISTKCDACRRTA